jgi:hypothetical protein
MRCSDSIARKAFIRAFDFLTTNYETIIHYHEKKYLVSLQYCCFWQE